MPKHNHTLPVKCDHELKHCDHCDAVFCEKCDREWKRGTNQADMVNLFRGLEGDNRKRIAPCEVEPWARSLWPPQPYTPTITWTSGLHTVGDTRPPVGAVTVTEPWQSHGKGA